MRPYKDDEVKLVGTSGEDSPWDPYMQRQYPEWQGWEAYAESQSDQYPDMTPEQWEEVFDWYHRKSFEINAPRFKIASTSCC